MRRPSPILLTLSLAAAMALPPLPGAAADGDLDTDFGGDGSNYWAVVNGFFYSEVITNAVVPGDHEIFLVATRRFNGNHVAFRAFDIHDDERALIDEQRRVMQPVDAFIAQCRVLSRENRYKHSRDKHIACVFIVCGWYNWLRRGRGNDKEKTMEPQ